MTKYILDIVAGKQVEKKKQTYGYSSYETEMEVQYILEKEIYEAITKYLIVKGFDATRVSVEEFTELSNKKKEQ